MQDLGEPRTEQARAIWYQALRLCKEGNEEDDDEKIRQSLFMKLRVMQLEPTFPGGHIEMHDWIRLFD